MMSRREVTLILALGFLAAPLALVGEPAGKVPTDGRYLLIGPSQCKLAPRGEAFYQGLRDLGLYPPPEHHSGPQVLGTDDEMRNVLSEFVDRKGDVIFVGAPGTGGRPVPKVTS
jgi:hypothetical protein